MSAASGFIQQTLQENPVVIFSKTSCPYCGQAKQVFDELRVPYLAVELNGRSDGSDIQEALRKMTGARTVPRVFVNKQCLGGGSDVQAMYKSRELQKLLQSQGLL